MVEDLGIPRTDRAVQAHAVLGDLLLATVFETKGTTRLVVVDLKTGQQEEVPLPGSTGGDALVADEEHGVAWIGTSLAPAVWRFDAATRRAERIAGLDPFLARERYVWSLALGPEGRLYAGTYPGGLLLLHDPARGVSKSLGPPMAGANTSGNCSWARPGPCTADWARPRPSSRTMRTAAASPT